MHDTHNEQECEMLVYPAATSRILCYM